MKKTFTHVLSTLLVCMLFGGTVPLITFAEGEVCEIVGGAKYSSFQDAIDAAVDGQTIRLLCDYTETDGVMVTNKTIYFDADNYTLTGVGLAVYGGAFLQKGSGIGRYNIEGICIGIFAINGAVSINGNVIVDGNINDWMKKFGGAFPLAVRPSFTSNNCGALASNGTVYVNGEITAESGDVAWFHNGIGNPNAALVAIPETPYPDKVTVDGIEYYEYSDGDGNFVYVKVPDAPSPPTPVLDPWWVSLPGWVQWILRWVCFGWIWMK